MMPRHTSAVDNKILTVCALVMIGLLVTLAPIVLPLHVVLAQSPITARVERSTINVDEQLVLNVTVSGDFLNIPRPDLAQIEDFVVVSSSTSTQVSIVNGKMTSQGVFIYRLQPLREGALVIAPISVNLNGQLFQTDPIDIEVLAGGSKSPPAGQVVPETEAPSRLSGQDFFVEAEVDNPNPYLGQQIVYTFRLYQAVNFFGQPDYQPPAFTDFWSSEVLSQPHYNTQANGRDYLVTEIRTALFPANLGSITIDPGKLVIPGGLLNPDIRLETNPVTINVRPLPEGKPEGFNGAVGQFQIRSTLSQIESKVNEPITLVIEISGSGNIQTLAEPALPDLSGWRFFDSKAATTIETGEGGLSGSRSFERLIVPGQPGQHTFPAISFSYYDPDLETYQTVNTDPIELNILPDDSAPVPLVVTGVDGEEPAVQRLASDIRHIKPVPSSLTVPGALSVAGRVLYWSGWILPLFLVGGAQIWQRRQRRLQQDTAFARAQRAQRNALKILTDAQRQGHGPTGYASAAGKALLGYLSDRLNTPTAGLTTDGLVRLLRQSRLETVLVEQVAALLHEIDIGRFAPVSEVTAQSLISKTRLLLNDLEKSFNRRRR